MTKTYGLPAFTFPVIAWAPEPATGDPEDDDTRSFLGPREAVTSYFPDTDLRLGWTFVDQEGRSWEAVSSRVTGRANWWTRFKPKWLGMPAYRLALEFEERPPVSFDAVKSRLHLAVTANPQILGYAQDRRAELRAAKDLGDLIKSDEDRAIERLRPSAWWWQWLVGEGRCPRRWFLLAGAAIVCAADWLLGASTAVPFPLWLGGVMALVAVSISTIVRRLHDLRLAGWWLLCWAPFTLLCALLYDRADSDTVRNVSAQVWRGVTLCALGLLAVWPGTKGDNRYGYGRPRPA